MGKRLIFLGVRMVVLAELSPAMCVFMSHFIICMASPGMGFRGWWFCNLYNPWSVCLCCPLLELWQFPFLLPLPPEGAVIYGQRLTSFAEASNSCANRSIKMENRDEELGKKENVLQMTHSYSCETQEQQNFCSGRDQCQIPRSACCSNTLEEKDNSVK